MATLNPQTQSSPPSFKITNPSIRSQQTAADETQGLFQSQRFRSIREAELSQIQSDFDTGRITVDQANRQIKKLTGLSVGRVEHQALQQTQEENLVTDFETGLSTRADAFSRGAISAADYLDYIKQGRARLDIVSGSTFDTTLTETEGQIAQTRRTRLAERAIDAFNRGDISFSVAKKRFRALIKEANTPREQNLIQQKLFDFGQTRAQQKYSEWIDQFNTNQISFKTFKSRINSLLSNVYVEGTSLSEDITSAFASEYQNQLAEFSKEVEARYNAGLTSQEEYDRFLQWKQKKEKTGFTFKGATLRVPKKL